LRIAGLPGDGRLAEPAADVRPRQWQLVKMPQSRLCSRSRTWFGSGHSSGSGVRVLRQRQAAGIAIAGFRQLAPIHDAGEEAHVAVVDLAGQRVLAGDIGKHLLAEPAEYLDQFVVETQNLDAFVVAQQLERLD